MSDFDRTPVAPPRKVAELRNDPYAGQSGDLSVNNALRAIGRGTVVGSYLDEMDAGSAAFLAPYADPLLPDFCFRRCLAERLESGMITHSLFSAGWIGPSTTSIPISPKLCKVSERWPRTQLLSCRQEGWATSRSLLLKVSATGKVVSATEPSRPLTALLKRL